MYVFSLEEFQLHCFVRRKKEEMKKTPSRLSTSSPPPLYTRSPSPRKSYYYGVSICVTIVLSKEYIYEVRILRIERGPFLTSTCLTFKVLCKGPILVLTPLEVSKLAFYRDQSPSLFPIFSLFLTTPLRSLST